LSEKKEMTRTGVLILDLDNTLIHSIEPNPSDSDDKEYLENAEKRGDKPAFQISSGNGSFTYDVYKRPYVDDFLRYACSNFDMVIVWSAGTKRYVELIVEKLFEDAGLPPTKPDMVLSKMDCDKINNGEDIRKNVNTVRNKFYRAGMKYNHNEILFVDDIPERITNLACKNIYEIPAYHAGEDDKEFEPFKNSEFVPIKQDERSRFPTFNISAKSTLKRKIRQRRRSASPRPRKRTPPTKTRRYVADVDDTGESESSTDSDTTGDESDTSTESSESTTTVDDDDATTATTATTVFEEDDE
jgi:hypothetical protein